MKPASFVRIATLWIATTCVFAQAKPAFEVASIKRNVSNAGGSFFRWEADGTLRVWNTSLQEIVRLAYYLDAYQVVDWPRWMADERFDIAAKPEGKPSQPVRIDMLRTLLAERFKLAMHTETRDGPAYALVVAKGEHLKLRPSDATDCGEPRRRSSGLAAACSLRTLPGHIVAADVPIGLLARTLATGLERPVANETGLLGNFDIDLTFAPESFGTPLQSGTEAVPDSNAPAIFTALREQLGLALETRRRPIDVYIVDHIERPTEN